MDFYNDALEDAKAKNVELGDACKEVLMCISTTIQDMALQEKSDFLKDLLKRWRSIDES